MYKVPIMTSYIINTYIIHFIILNDLLYKTHAITKLMNIIEEIQVSAC